MAGVSLKKDFKDGDKLFGQQLNNNFGAIEAALNAMNKIVWQDDPDDMVVTFRGTTEEINSRDIIDGQLLYDTTTGETYIDYGSQRISTGSGNAIFIGDTEPSNPSTQLWINPDEPMQVIGSEVVNSLEGDETNKAPSVDAIKKGIIDSGSNENGNYIKFYDGTMICSKVVSGTYQCNQSDGSVYKTQDINLGDYTQTFTQLPTISGSVGGTSFCWLGLIGGSSQSVSSPGIAVLMRPTSSSLSARINIIAIGRWK